jgi:LPS export ABC transporter protein LptC
VSSARSIRSRVSALPARGWLLTLVPAIIIAWLMTGQLDNPSEQAQPSLTQLPPGARYEGFGTGIRSRVFDQTGNLLYTIQAEAQRLFPAQLTELDQPVVRMYEEDQQRWHISAVSGRIRASSGGDVQRMDLTDNVRIVHTPDLRESVQLDTEWLIIEPAARRLHTDAAVHVSGDRIEQRALGLKADFSLSSLEFVSNVEGRLNRITE